MKKVSVFDIEATNWINFACLGFFDGEDYKVFWSIESFLEHFLTKKYRGWKCYAHFGGKYDFRFLIPVIAESKKYDMKFIERGSRIMAMKVICRKTRMTWRFSDSFFLLPASLKELGKNFGIKYLKEDFDVENEKDFKSEKAQKYLMNDCLGLYEILEKFSRWGLNSGKLKATIPAQSLYVFKEKFLNFELEQINKTQEEFIRKTYFGGRVEIFKTYGENLFYYDFNSLYPSVMMEEMPCGSCCYVKRYIKGKIGFYRIKANIQYLHIPPLPTLIDKKLFFPYGEGEFYTSIAELNLLDKLGVKYEIIEGYVFSEKKAIFKEYISEMYDLRQKFGRGTMENLLAKLLMNSLYGKFGQKRINRELIFTENPPDKCLVYDEKFSLYLVETESKSRDILPYLSSYITSLARVRLYELFLAVGVENVWYCDTDSIITDKKLPTGEGLGKLKLEYEIKRGVFLQPKAYCLELQSGEIISKVKGMKNSKIGINLFLKALKENNLELINTKYYNIMGFRECIRRNKSFKIKRIEIFKKLYSLYNKRKINQNYLTEPYEIGTLLNMGEGKQ